jgi:integrase
LNAILQKLAFHSELVYAAPLLLHAMAHLFRPTYTRVDPATGEDVEYQLEKWYADYRDSNGKRCRVPLSADKSSAQTMLADIIRKVERQKAGIIDKTADELEKPVSESIDEYKKHLESNGRSETHVTETIRQIRKLANETGCVLLGDLQRAENSIEKFLADRQQAGNSYRTINAHLTAIRSFCRWLIQKKRLSADPTIHFNKLNVSVDRRKERRPLTDEEASKLFKTTLESERVFRELTGQDRAMLYMLAQRTGLRRRELLTLMPRSFKLDGKLPTVRVEARNSKHRKEDVLPLPAEIAKELAAYLKNKKRSEPIWPGNWWEKSAKMFRSDLSAAGIQITDEDGKVLDFHGQRMTFISGLARAGVSPAKAQKLARHSDVNLTMRAYTHLQAEDLASAVEQLPSLRDGKHLREKGVGCEAAADSQLQRLVELWPKLSDQIRQSIAALIDNPAGQDG